tara:strand:- start:13 stop:357 length:345 start_codon:yes stop_codon:yes gene_type:complete
MRIISGKAKGKKVLIPKDKKTRPLKDMVKESIFNIIKHSDLLRSKFDQCVILDLFLGLVLLGLKQFPEVQKKLYFLRILSRHWICSTKILNPYRLKKKLKFTIEIFIVKIILQN